MGRSSPTTNDPIFTNGDGKHSSHGIEIPRGKVDRNKSRQHSTPSAHAGRFNGGNDGSR